MKPNITYKVKLTKTFDYPKAMLLKGAEKQDASAKGVRDMQITVSEIMASRSNVDVSKMFEVECIEDKGYKLRNKKEEPVYTQLNIQEIVEILATSSLEEKVGLLNIEENPDFFEYEEDTWYLRSDLEKQLEILRNKYKKKLNYFFRGNLRLHSFFNNSLSERIAQMRENS